MENMGQELKKQMRIKFFFDIFFDEMLLFHSRGFDSSIHYKAFFDELKLIEETYNAKLDVTLLTGYLAKPGDRNWETDGIDVWQILEDFKKAGLDDRVTSFIGANSITPPHNRNTTVKTTSGFNNGKVVQLLNQFDPERNDIIFYLYAADSRKDGMYWNHFMLDELKDAPFVYICSANKKLFGRGEIFDCQKPNTSHRGNEFEYLPEKAVSGIVSIIQGIKDVRRMKSRNTDNVQDTGEKAIKAAEDFFNALALIIDENVLKHLPADKLIKIFSEASKLQRRAFEHALGISPQSDSDKKTEERDKIKELFI